MVRVLVAHEHVARVDAAAAAAVAVAVVGRRRGGRGGHRLGGQRVAEGSDEAGKVRTVAEGLDACGCRGVAVEVSQQLRAWEGASVHPPVHQRTPQRYARLHTANGGSAPLQLRTVEQRLDRRRHGIKPDRTQLRAERAGVQRARRQLADRGVHLAMRAEEVGRQQLTMRPIATWNVWERRSR